MIASDEVGMLTGENAMFCPNADRRWGVDIRDRHPAFLVELDPCGC